MLSFKTSLGPPCLSNAKMPHPLEYAISPSEPMANAATFFAITFSVWSSLRLTSSQDEGTSDGTPMIFVPLRRAFSASMILPLSMIVLKSSLCAFGPDAVVRGFLEYTSEKKSR